MSPELLSAATGCALLRAGLYAAAMTAAMARHNINTPRRQAGFLAQVAHECGSFRNLEESLNYTALRLTQVWPKRFPTLDDAAPLANNPAALANRVYGGRMGNVQPDDGYKYRGRGPLMLTGRANYEAYARASGTDVVSNPDLLLQPEHGSDSAAWAWSSKGCNEHADRSDWTAVTQAINGGKIGLAERFLATQRALKAIGEGQGSGIVAQGASTALQPVGSVNEPVNAVLTGVAPSAPAAKPVPWWSALLALISKR